MPITNHPALNLTSAIERRKAESDALFMSIGEGAITVDRDGKIARINDAALELLGVERYELLGKWYPEVMVAEDEDENIIPNDLRPITESILSGKSVFKKIYYRRKNGSRIAVALTVSPILLNSKPIGAIQVFRDITEEVALEKAKDEFIALASHQLRTPATIVKQYVGMLLEGYAGKVTARQLDMLQNAYDSNERQINIINDLLRVAHADAGKVKLQKQPLDLCKLTKEVAVEQKPRFDERSQKLSLSSTHQKIIVLADQQKLRMVIENIIDNASKYTPTDKKVSIELRATPNKAFLQVRDEGVGIAKEDLDLIFGKFARVNNPLSALVGGTGLGLYWVQKIIKLHGAQIEVLSEPDKGSIFTICFPRVRNTKL